MHHRDVEFTAGDGGGHKRDGLPKGSRAYGWAKRLWNQRTLVCSWAGLFCSLLGVALPATPAPVVLRAGYLIKGRTLPAIVTASPLPAAITGTGYSLTLAASGTAPITWAVTSGALPAGLALGPSTGLISGTPTTPGLSTFTITATDPAGSSSKQLSLTAKAMDNLGIWIASSLERVGLNDAPGAQQAVDISSGRNQYESFQVAIQAPPGGLTNVALNVTELKGPGNTTIAASNIFLYREGYVYINRSSPDPAGSTNHPGAPGWYPDPLIPLQNAQGQPINTPSVIPSATNQPFWIDVYVPANTAPGVYTGAVTVSIGAAQIQLPLTLTVWSFLIPETPSLKSTFPVTHYLHNDTVDAQLLQHQVMDMLIDPSLTRTPPGNTAVNITGLPFSSGATNGNCVMSAPPTAAAISLQAQYFPSALSKYVWVADEIGACTNLYGAIQQWAQHIHQAGALSLITMPPNLALFDDGLGAGHTDVDIWVVLPKDWDTNINAIQQAKAKGNSIWSYNALVQDNYSPKWEIDFDPINYRIQPGMISQSLGLTGLLYWRVDNWSTQPWTQVNNEGVFDTNNYPGDGMLVYPGNVALTPGVVPSMRLKQIRDGIYDFDYIEMLKQKGLGPFALGVAASVGKDWHTWTHDAGQLQQARNALGIALDTASH